MNRASLHWVFTPTAAAAAVAASLAIPACNRSTASPPSNASSAAASQATSSASGAPPGPARSPDGRDASLLSPLVQPEKVQHSQRISASGTLKARQSSALAMSVPGTLVLVAVRRGQEAQKGALLASLDDGAAAAAVKQAEAAVAAAKAQLALATDTLERVSRIREQEGASEAQLFQARAQRDLASAQVAAADAQLSQARVNLSHHHLHAPFAGVVTHVPDGLGITVAPGVPLVTLVSTHQLVLETSITQSEAAEVRTGMKVQVSVPATGARTSDATVSVVVPAVDPATNRVPIEVTVLNGGARFLPNAFARAELPRGAERTAFKLPAASLVQREGGHAAWVAGADGRAQALPVLLLAEEGDFAVVVPEGGKWPASLRVVAAPPLGITEGTRLAESGR